MVGSLSDGLLIGVDAGGTSTRLVARRLSSGEEIRLEDGSINPASSTGSAIVATWRRLLNEVRQRFSGASSFRAWVASASVTDATIDDEARRLDVALSSLDMSGTAVLSGDVLPLLFSPELGGVGAVLVAGTGSCAIGRNPAGATHLAGGREYLLSDEGSGFDLGRQGLRAVVRSADGRGAPTSLTRLAGEHWNAPIDVVARIVATASSPKASVAAFAPSVLSAWIEGDKVAAGLVHAAARDLVDHVAAVLAVVGPLDSAVLAGGLLQNRAFSDVVELRLRSLGIHRCVHVGDTALLCLDLAADGPTAADVAPFPIRIIDGAQIA